MKQLPIFTQPPDAEVSIRHDDAGGDLWHGVAGTYMGRPAQIVTVPDGIADGHGAQLLINAIGRSPIDLRGFVFLSRRSDPSVAEFSPDDYRLVSSFNPRRLPRLVVRGQFFALETGERFTAIEASDFNLLARWIKEGPDAVDPIFAQRAALGFNMLRVWTYMSLSQFGIGDLNPHDYPDFYTKLIPAFVGHAARYGLYIEFTAYTSSPGREDLNHWSRLGWAAQLCTSAILELVNENDIAVNTIDTSKFFPIPGVLCSHGSNGSESWPVDPPWDYETYHTNGAYEWQRKVGHNAMEIADARGRPVLSNENTRFDDRDSSSYHAFDAAAGAALLCAGSCFHSVPGKSSQLFTGSVLTLAAYHTAGAKSVPLEFQAGRYIRHDDLPEGIIRIYERRLADGRGKVVYIHE